MLWALNGLKDLARERDSNTRIGGYTHKGGAEDLEKAKVYMGWLLELRLRLRSDEVAPSHSGAHR